MARRKPEDPSKVRVRVLGATEITVGHRRIGMNTELLFALALYLTTRAGEQISREELLELFWLEGSDEDRRQQARTARTAVPPPTAAPEEVVPTRSPGTRFWFAALVIALILVVLAAGLTALGYGPLASRFKPVRTSTAPASAGVAS